MSNRTVYLTTTTLQPISKIPEGYSVQIWRPSLFKLKPPGKPLKYLIFSFASVLKLLSNRNFFQISVYNQSTLVSSLLVVPKIYKFPYMNKKDIQFIYVMTNYEYRGKSIAAATILESTRYLIDTVESFWYVTSEDNIASLKLAEKLGFKIHKK